MHRFVKYKHGLNSVSKSRCHGTCDSQDDRGEEGHGGQVRRQGDLCLKPTMQTLTGQTLLSLRLHFRTRTRARLIPSSKNCCKGEMNVKMVTDACIKLEPFLERQGLQSGDELHS